MRGQGESSALSERFPDRHAAARLSQTRIFPEPRRRIDCHGLRPRNDRTQFLRHVDTWEPPCGYTNDHCAVTLRGHCIVAFGVFCAAMFPGLRMTMLRCLCTAMSGIFCAVTLRGHCEAPAEAIHCVILPMHTASHDRQATLYSIGNKVHERDPFPFFERHGKLHFSKFPI